MERFIREVHKYDKEIIFKGKSLNLFKSLNFQK